MACLPIGNGDKRWQDMIRARHWSRFISIGGHRLHYLETGRGRPVLLIHGYADSVYTWHRNIEPLAKAGCRVLAIDLPGMGDSEPPPGRDFSPRALSRIIGAFIEEKMEGKGTIIGHSLGGSLSLHLASIFPEMVNRLVSVAPACYLGPRLRLYIGIAGSAYIRPVIKSLTGPWVFHYSLRRAYYNPGLVSGELVSQKAQPFKRPDFSDNLLDLAAGFFSYDNGWFSRILPGIKTPTLLVWGSRDRIVDTEKNAVKVHRAIPGSQLAVIPQTGHLPHQENPKAFNRLVLDFFEQSVP